MPRKITRRRWSKHVEPLNEYVKTFKILPTERNDLQRALELKRVLDDGFQILINGILRYYGIVFTYADALQKIEALRRLGLAIEPMSKSKAIPSKIEQEIREQREHLLPHDLNKCGLCLRKFLASVCDQRESKIFTARKSLQDRAYPPKRKPYKKRSVPLQISAQI